MNTKPNVGVTLAFLVFLAVGGCSDSGSGNGNGPTGPNPGSGDVSVGDNFFSPQDFTTGTGSGVEWSWNGNNPHTVTFDNINVDSGVRSSGTFAHTFNALGTFTYFCTVHGKAVMSGSIVVQ